MQQRFPIRDVCTFLGVKPHVLRYWEKEIPFLSPRKTVTGHREYTWNDLEILFRIRHLHHDKGYTLSGVRNKLWEEASADYQDAKARISAIRAELMSISVKIRERTK